MKIKRFTLLITIIISFLFTPYAAKICVQIFGRQGGGFWGPSNPEYFWGFLMNILLFGSFFSWFLYNKWKVWFYHIFPVLLFFLFLQSWKDLTIGAALVAAGIILAQIFLLIKRYIFKIKPGELPDTAKARPVLKNKESLLGKMRLILIIYLSLEFFTGLLMGLNAGGSVFFILTKIISLVIIIISVCYLIKNNPKCYWYIVIYSILGVIMQFLGRLDYMALTVYAVLAIFFMYKSISSKNNYNFNQVIINTVIFVLVLSLLFKFPIFLLSILSFIELFGGLFTQ